MASSKKTLVVSKGQIDSMIRSIRGVRVMLDSDLAKIYGVPTFRFNEAIKRNRHRFPADFMFQLTREEFDALRSQIAMSSGKHRGATYRPYAFTEHGALQAANVLRSTRAVQMSVFVIRAFVKMRETLLGTRELAKKLKALAYRQFGNSVVVPVVERIAQSVAVTLLHPHFWIRYTEYRHFAKRTL